MKRNKRNKNKKYSSRNMFIVCIGIGEILKESYKNVIYIIIFDVFLLVSFFVCFCFVFIVRHVSTYDT